jgi:phage recombination protein Bet
MNTKTDQLPATTARQEIGRLRGPRLPYHDAIGEKFGIDVASWKALCESLYPTAKTTDAVVLALSYCKARKLDIMKKPIHIVPMWNSDLHREVETVWPAITEYRITAHRTGQYAGNDPVAFGPDKTMTFKAEVKKGKMKGRILEATLTFPEWAQVTVYRMVEGERVPFHGPQCRFLEYYGMMMGLQVPNARWQRSPYQMIGKCAEAAALRLGFTEELGNVPVAEEMEGRIFQQVMEKFATQRPEQTTKPAATSFPYENEIIDVPDEDEDEDEADGEFEDGSEQPAVVPDLPKDAEPTVAADPIKVDPPVADDAYRDWLRDQYAALEGAKLDRTVDDLQDHVTPQLKPDDVKPWVDACNAKAKALSAAKKK